MGLMISSQVNTLIIEFLRQFQSSGKDSFTVDRYEQEFNLNGTPGSPKCKILIKNSSIASPNHWDVEEALYAEQPIVIKAPVIVIKIGHAATKKKIGVCFSKAQPADVSLNIFVHVAGEAVFSCDQLGYTFRVSGNLQLSRVRLNASVTASFDEGLQIEDINSKVRVEKIKSDIQLLVNGGDHSRIANAILSTDDPALANSILNAVLVTQKGMIKDLLKANLEGVTM